MVPWFLAEGALAFGLVLAVGRSPLRRLAASLLFIAGAALPWWAPPRPVPRVFLAFIALLAGMKGLQIAMDPSPWPLLRRVVHMAVPFDTREIRHTRPAFAGGILANALVHGVIGAVLVWALLQGPLEPWPLRVPYRALTGGLLAWAGIEFGLDLPRFFLALAGFQVPPVQRRPLLARTLTDFWGRRWNRPVSAWLSRFVFLPLARRRLPGLGLLMGFLASGALHAGMVAASMSWRETGSVFGFFALQGVGTLVEARLGVSAWPAPAARAWTFACLLLPAPLFLEPFLQALGL